MRLLSHNKILIKQVSPVSQTSPDHVYVQPLSDGWIEGLGHRFLVLYVVVWKFSSTYFSILKIYLITQNALAMHGLKMPTEMKNTHLALTCVTEVFQDGTGLEIKLE